MHLLCCMFEAGVQLCLSGFSGTRALRISKGFGNVGHGNNTIR